MSEVHILTITADHDFDAVRTVRAFADRQAAEAWAAKWIESEVAFQDSIDPAFGAHAFTATINTLPVQ
jgi:hypothetical protein